MIKRLLNVSLIFILSCSKGELPVPQNLDTWEPIIGYNTPKNSNTQLRYNLSVNTVGLPPAVNPTPPAGHHNGYTFGYAGWANLEYNNIFKFGWVSFNESILARTDIIITAVPGEGYEFSEWSNGQTVNPITFKLNSNTDLTASFITRND